MCGFAKTKTDGLTTPPASAGLGGVNRRSKNTKVGVTSMAPAVSEVTPALDGVL